MQRDENHPRPQLIRASWIDLCGEWQFAYDDAGQGLKQGWVDRPQVFNRTITVPFPPESAASGIGDKDFHPIVWYRRTFQFDKAQLTGRLLLHFGAVDYRAQVWVNGQYVAGHEGGNTPFNADITTALRPDTPEQVIVVRAEDQPEDLTQPRGKQYWKKNPQRIWYDRTTGIWQPVWLEPVPDTYISELRWTPDLDRGLLGLEVKLNEKPAGSLKVNVKLSLKGEILASDTYYLESAEIKREIALDLAALTWSREDIAWSPGSPNLIDAEITLLEDEKPLDQVLSYAGMRSVGFHKGRFILNGRPYFLRMVLEQGYWPDTQLSAPGNEALRREVELAKELGFNGVRIHQKVEDPRFLYWCDRLGLLVWSEMANAYIFTATAVERFIREWLEVVRRDYSHPCIVTWVPFNESWGLPGLERDVMQQHYVKALYYMTQALDSTRPVIGNDGWEHVVGDIWGIHDYARDGATIRERYGSAQAVENTIRLVQPQYRNILIGDTISRGEPIMLTEVGGFTLKPQKGTAWWGYDSANDSATLLERYADLVGAILDCPTIAGFCYTQLTDTGQETNGLLRADRTPKLDVSAVKAITSRPSKSNPADFVRALQMANLVKTFQSNGSDQVV